jgi:hypothetical protein
MLDINLDFCLKVKPLYSLCISNAYYYHIIRRILGDLEMVYIGLRGSRHTTLFVKTSKETKQAITRIHELLCTLKIIIHNAPIDEHFSCIKSELDTLTCSESKMILMFILFLATSKWASIMKAMPKLLGQRTRLNNQWHHYCPTNPNCNIKKMILISFNQLILNNTSFFSLRAHFTAKFQMCSTINNLYILLNVLRNQGVHPDLKRLDLLVGLIQRLIPQYNLLFCVCRVVNENHL